MAIKLTPEQVKAEAEGYRDSIEYYQRKLQYLQEKYCNHSNTHTGLYSWRLGTAHEAIICSDCGKLIEVL